MRTVECIMAEILEVVALQYSENNLGTLFRAINGDDVPTPPASWKQCCTSFNLKQLKPVFPWTHMNNKVKTRQIRIAPCSNSRLLAICFMPKLQPWGQIARYLAVGWLKRSSIHRHSTLMVYLGGEHPYLYQASLNPNVTRSSFDQTVKPYSVVRSLLGENKPSQEKWLDMARTREL